MSAMSTTCTDNRYRHARIAPPFLTLPSHPVDCATGRNRCSVSSHEVSPHALDWAATTKANFTFTSNWIQ